MLIGIPKETKIGENRVAGTPEAVRELVQNGQRVLVEKRAGLGSGFSDKEYFSAGAKIISQKAEIYKKADLIWKVKEPSLQEVHFYRRGQILFTFLHLAADPKLTHSLCRQKITAIGYETVQLPDGSLPLLAPMSEAAGKLAAVIGANYLRKDLGGKGILLSGIHGKFLGKVTILGLGIVGRNALAMAHGLGGRITAFDLSREKLKLQNLYPERLSTHLSDPKMIAEAVRYSDLVIGAVLVPGKKAPTVVTRPMVRSMEPGSVIVDVAVDQGGCIATTHPTTHANPVYRVDGILHYAVTNIPSLAGRSATQALSSVTLPYLKKITSLGLEEACQTDPSLQKGINISNGEIVHPALRQLL
ncbi:MAG: alanine dehydrogenase [Deltaproteobacteria bacterium]|nr:alanine dehydrogenase [Deltaproteobacteria bacterium]